jgi:hypothetical protein
MSDDIVERLRQQATIGAKKFGDAADIPLEWKAATEIARLRARVEVLEDSLRELADHHPESKMTRALVRFVGLEAKP